MASFTGKLCCQHGHPRIVDFKNIEGKGARVLTYKGHTGMSRSIGSFIHKKYIPNLGRFWGVHHYIQNVKNWP